MEELIPGEFRAAQLGGTAAAKQNYLGAGSNPMDAALMVRFYRRAAKNEAKTLKGYHFVNEDGEQVVFSKDLDLTKHRSILCDCINPDNGQYSEILKREAIKAGYHVTPKAPVFEDLTMIQIRVANQLDYIDDVAWLDFSPTPRTGAHNIRFRRQYEHFLEDSEGQLILGTPVEQLTKTNPQVLTLGQVEDFKYRHVMTVEALVALPAPETSGIMGIHAIIAKAKEFLKAQEAAFPAQQMKAELAARDLQIAAQAQQLADLVAQMQQLGGGKPPPSLAAPKSKRAKKTEAA